MEAADLDAWATCYWCAMNEQEAEDEEDKGKAKAAKDPAKASGIPRPTIFLSISSASSLLDRSLCTPRCGNSDNARLDRS